MLQHLGTLEGADCTAPQSWAARTSPPDSALPQTTLSSLRFQRADQPGAISSTTDTSREGVGDKCVLGHSCARVVPFGAVSEMSILGCSTGPLWGGPESTPQPDGMSIEATGTPALESWSSMVLKGARACRAGGSGINDGHRPAMNERGGVMMHV